MQLEVNVEYIPPSSEVEGWKNIKNDTHIKIYLSKNHHERTYLLKNGRDVVSTPRCLRQKAGYTHAKLECFYQLWLLINSRAKSYILTGGRTVRS